jgi:hypothetical protein
VLDFNKIIIRLSLFGDRLIEEVILIIYLASVCSESLLVKSWSGILVGDDLVDFLPVIDKQLLEIPCHHYVAIIDLNPNTLKREPKLNHYFVQTIGHSVN